MSTNGNVCVMMPWQRSQRGRLELDSEFLECPPETEHELFLKIQKPNDVGKNGDGDEINLLST